MWWNSGDVGLQIFTGNQVSVVSFKGTLDNYVFAVTKERIWMKTK